MKKGSRHTNSSITVLDFAESYIPSFRSKVAYMAERLGEDSPLVLHIDSFGGDVYALISYISILEAVPHKLVTYAGGKAMSCGSILLTYGDVAIMSPDATMLIHSMQLVDSGSMPQMRHNMTHNEHLTATLRKYYTDAILKRLGSTPAGKKAVKKVLEFMEDGVDHYLTAAQCKELGLIDHIGYLSVVPKFFLDVNVMSAEPIAAPKVKGGKDVKPKAT